ncbi:MAG: serine/threonine protein kinase [Planctomycetes bacterium]|nr:serine/threonine protein kinase [Planctomycetota bacterium]
MNMNADDNESTNQNNILNAKDAEGVEDAENANTEESTSLKKDVKVTKTEYTLSSLVSDSGDKTSKTLQPDVQSTKTLIENPGLEKADELPEHQPPYVAESAEQDKTEKLHKLGKYYLLKEISRSPNGVVYKARHEEMHSRIVALKVMSNEDDNQHVDRINRFKQEIDHISRLQHPNIVAVYDIGTIDAEGAAINTRWLFFTMAFVEGESLSQLIKHKPLPVNHAVRLIIKSAKGIHYANQRGIIHRDIKPSNILLDKHTGEPMIVDFGLAKDIKSDIKITQSGVTLGTPPYMPPEQARGMQDMLDSRSDVYSLGATLYELITGKAPFEGETGMQILVKVLNNTPSRPRRYNSSISPDLEAIILKCLSKKQGDRYENSENLASDLKKYLRGDWVSARQNTPINRLLTKIYSYRYMIYSVLFAMLAISIFVLSGYFRGEIDRLDVISPLTITKTDVVGLEKRRFKIIGIENDDKNSAKYERDLWLHDEIWINNSTEPFSKSFEQNNFAGMMLSQPIGSTDFKIELNIEILPFEEECPNFSFFLTSNETVSEIKSYSDPVLEKGYLLTIGANDNSGWVFYRNGVAKTGDSSFILDAQNYKVKIQVNNGRFSIEIQDLFRQLFTLNYTDEYPIPLVKGGHFGFLSINTPVVISSMKLSLISPATHELEKPDRLFNLGLFEEALIDYQQKTLFAKVRKNYELFYESKFKSILCQRIIGSLSSEDANVKLAEFKDLISKYKPAQFEYMYLQNLFENRDFAGFINMLESLLADDSFPQDEMNKILYACYLYAESAFNSIYSHNLLLDIAQNKTILSGDGVISQYGNIDIEQSVLIEAKIIRRFFDRDLHIPEADMNFCIAVLKLIINSGIADEYIKQKSRNKLFHVESIDNYAGVENLTMLDKLDFMTLLLNHDSLKYRDPQCQDFKRMINLLILLKNSKIKDYDSLADTVSDYRKEFTPKKGFRYKYWLEKFNCCIDEITDDKETE